MGKIRKVWVLLAVFVLGVLVLPATSGAEQMTWEVKSLYRYKVQIEFYSQDRNRAWPGGDRAYNLNDYDTHSFTLNCNSGEKICYGAWDANASSTYWGVGKNDRQGCQGCCYTCDGDTYSVRLRR
jgi:hypothetical protein